MNYFRSSQGHSASASGSLFVLCLCLFPMGLSAQDAQLSAGDADAIVAMLVDSVAPVDGSWRVTRYGTARSIY
jgi:hypothetical protein